MVEKVQAKIVSMSRFNDTIWQYVLKPEHFVPYQAGQYLQIHSAEGDHYYSIANAPAQGQYYELHVRHRVATQVWSDQHPLALSLPYGVCDLSHLQVHKPILFLAVGTGFSSIRAMIDQLLWQSDPRHFELYWGVALAEDVYDQARLQNWQAQRADFRYFPHISPTNQSALIKFVLQAHQRDLQHWQVVMAGPFELMYAMRDELLQEGLDLSAIFSDAFAFV